jgi:hypothetical protein
MLKHALPNLCATKEVAAVHVAFTWLPYMLPDVHLHLPGDHVLPMAHAEPRALNAICCHASSFKAMYVA